MNEAVAILGSGTMGCDLSILFARHGYSVRLWHRVSAQKAAVVLGRRIDDYVTRGILSRDESERIRASTEFTDSTEQAARSSWIIETVTEDLGVKRDLLATMDRLRAVDSVLMSNTSSLPLERLAHGMGHVASFVGVHFFNPALRIRVVEVAPVAGTSAEIVPQIDRWLMSIGMEPVRVGGRPGMVVNRLMAGLVAQAFRLWEEGVGSPADIDRLAVGALGHPIGPLALADLVGLDVMLRILTTLSSELPDESLRPPQSLSRLVAHGRLGRKTGHGVFPHPAVDGRKGA